MNEYTAKDFKKGQPPLFPVLVVPVVCPII